MSTHQPEELSPKEIARRRDAAILRALKTPHREQKAEPKPQTAQAEAQRQRRERERRAAATGD
jgi:hypothetical protein